MVLNHQLNNDVFIGFAWIGKVQRGFLICQTDGDFSGITQRNTAAAFGLIQFLIIVIFDFFGIVFLSTGA